MCHTWVFITITKNIQSFNVNLKMFSIKHFLDSNKGEKTLTQNVGRNNLAGARNHPTWIRSKISTHKQHTNIKGCWKLLKMWLKKLHWTAARTHIQCNTAASWLMSVVSAPLDTRLLLCGLMQPHAIKQKSYCMQGWNEETAQHRVSRFLLSRLSSPPRLSLTHTHTSQRPSGAQVLRGE